MAQGTDDQTKETIVLFIAAIALFGMVLITLCSDDCPPGCDDEREMLSLHCCESEGIP
jgi:hypothetical protein